MALLFPGLPLVGGRTCEEGRADTVRLFRPPCVTADPKECGNQLLLLLLFVAAPTEAGSEVNRAHAGGLVEATAAGELSRVRAGPAGLCSRKTWRESSQKFRR